MKTKTIDSSEGIRFYDYDGKPLPYRSFLKATYVIVDNPINYKVFLKKCDDESLYPPPPPEDGYPAIYCLMDDYWEEQTAVVKIALSSGLFTKS